MTGGIVETVLGLIAGAALGMAVGAWLAARRIRAEARRLVAAFARRCRARLGLARAEAQRVAVLLDRTFSAVNVGLVHIDRDQRIRAANPTACRWFDLKPDALPTLMAAAASADLRDFVESALAGRSTGIEPARLAIHRRVYRVNVSVLPDGGALLALRDDTDTEHLARARRDLVVNLSHDIRTPLTSIGLLVDALLGEPGDDPDGRRKLLGRVHEQVATLTEMADGLVELSRLDEGRALVKLRPERLRPLVARVGDGFWSRLSEGDVRIDLAVPDGLEVLVDPPQLARVLGNLLDNAVRFSPRGGVVRIGAEAREGGEVVEIHVSDDGPGIAPIDVDRVFERFYQGDPSRSGAGNGLGLAIARHIVAGHGGRMWVDQTAPRGATLRFTVPATATPGAAGDVDRAS